MRKLAAPLFWLLVWEGLSLLVGRELLLPGPAAVLRRLVSLSAAAAFWRTVGVSLLRIFCGVLLSLLLGTILAALTVRFPPLDALLRPPLAAVKAAPVASFIILIQLWLGRNILPAFIAGLIVLPVVFANVSAGIRETDAELLEVARVFRFSRGKTLLRVYVPSVAPWFFSACRSALGMGWKAGVAAEVLAVPAVSIGKMLMESKLYLETVDLFAWTAAVILCSVFIEKLLAGAAGRLENRYGRRDHA